jgi:hypothetical protein
MYVTIMNNITEMGNHDEFRNLNPGYLWRTEKKQKIEQEWSHREAELSPREWGIERRLSLSPIQCLKSFYEQSSGQIEFSSLSVGSGPGMSWITTHLRAQGQHEPHVKTAM